jgi:hypothetical protein
MSKKSEKIHALYKEAVRLEVGTSEIKAYFQTLGMASPTEAEFAFFRIGLIAAEAVVL